MTCICNFVTEPSSGENIPANFTIFAHFVRDRLWWAFQQNSETSLRDNIIDVSYFTLFEQAIACMYYLWNFLIHTVLLLCVITVMQPFNAPLVSFQVHQLLLPCTVNKCILCSYEKNDAASYCHDVCNSFDIFLLIICDQSWETEFNRKSYTK